MEIVRRGRTRWYRVVRDGAAIDWLTIGGVERVLAEAGVDMADLIDAGPVTPAR